MGKYNSTKVSSNDHRLNPVTCAHRGRGLLYLKALAGLLSYLACDWLNNVRWSSLGVNGREVWMTRTLSRPCFIYKIDGMARI